MSNYIFVDVEALGTSPVRGTMTEFGAVHYKTKETFHGILFEGTPDPENPAVPVVGDRLATDTQVAVEFADWLKEVCGNSRPVFISDNVAYDWMWIAGMFDRAYMDNPFGHSGRRISDFWAGLNHNFSETQSWKRFRKTKHDHNPVNDAMGNVEAFERIIKIAKAMRGGLDFFSAEQTTRGNMVTDTSRAAFNEVKPELGDRQQLVLNTIKRAKRPVNDQEIADFLRKPINTITPRRNELVSLEAIELAFKATYPVTNRKVCYWRVK